MNLLPENAHSDPVSPNRHDRLQSFARVLRSVESVSVPLRRMSSAVVRLSSRPTLFDETTERLRQTMGALTRLGVRLNGLFKAAQLPAGDLNSAPEHPQRSGNQRLKYKPARSDTSEGPYGHPTANFDAYELLTKTASMLKATRLIDIAAPPSISLGHFVVLRRGVNSQNGDARIPRVSHVLLSPFGRFGKVARVPQTLSYVPSSPTASPATPDRASSEGSGLKAPPHLPVLNMPGGDWYYSASRSKGVLGLIGRSIPHRIQVVFSYFASGQGRKRGLAADLIRRALWTRVHFSMQMLATAILSGGSNRTFRGISSTPGRIGTEYPDLGGRIVKGLNNVGTFTVEDLHRVPIPAEMQALFGKAGFGSRLTTAPIHGARAGITDAAQRIAPLPVRRLRTQISTAHTVRLNCSPTVVISGKHEHSDIERAVLGAIESHGHELVRILNRELTKHKRTEF